MTGKLKPGRTLGAAAALAVCLQALPLWAQQTTPSFEVGQAIEVREGDTWSPATVLKREGRRYQIKYADGTDEWVTPDRMRTPAAGAAAGKPEPAPKPRPVVWQVGQDVEVKWGGTWRKAKVLKKRGEWLMMAYEGHDTFVEWVEPWRLRKVGSTDDIPYAAPNSSVRKTDPPPRPEPGPPPQKNTAASGADAFEPEVFELPVTAADMKAAKKVVPALAQTWKYKPAAAAAASTVPFRPIALAGPLRKNEAQHVVDFNKGHAIIGYSVDAFGAKSTSVEVVNLAAGTTRKIDLHKASLPLAVTPDGKHVVARAFGFFGGTRHRIDVWDVSGAQAKHALSFVPAPGEGGGKAADVDDVLVLDDGHLLTRSGATLACWQFQGTKALWTMSLGSATPTLALSPDRKSIALASGGTLWLLNALSGDVLGSISEGVPNVSSLAFSPSGKRVFGASAGGVVPFDLETGVAAPSVAMSRRTGGSILPLSDRLVDVGGVVIDVDRATVVATLTRPAAAQSSSDGGWLAAVTGTDTARSLSTWRLPMPAIEQLADSAKPAKAVRLSSGTAISLDLALPVDGQQADQVTAAVRGNLERAGLKVVESAPLRLVARVEDGKTEERMYEGRGFPRSAQERVKVSVTEKITRLWLESDGQRVWETSQSAWPPFHIDRKDGQSVEDAVRAANVPNVEFLKSVALPATIITEEPATLRKLELVPGGVK